MADQSQPQEPARRPLPEHLTRIALIAVPVVVVIAFVIAALATSRAAAHALSPLALESLVCAT